MSDTNTGNELHSSMQLPCCLQVYVSPFFVVERDSVSNCAGTSWSAEVLSYCNVKQQVQQVSQWLNIQ